MKEVKAKRRWLPILGVGLLIGLGLGLLFVYGFNTRAVSWLAGKTVSDSVQIGAAAPDFELETLSGDTVRLSNLQGKPVLINFWATWCAPCVLEMPNFQKYYENYPGAFEILAINYGEPVDMVDKFIRDIGATYPVLFDYDSKVQGVYRFPGYPTTYFVDKNGIVQIQHVGLMDESALERYLNELGALQ